MRIAFIGTVEFSLKALEKLIQMKEDIVCVLTKKSSLNNSDYADLSVVCKKKKIDFKYVNNINDSEILEYLKEKKPDVIYCFGWSQLVKKQLIEFCPLGIVGYHPAELPKNRGRHPLIWALALGLEHTASTFYFMDEGADSGDILSQKKIEIEYTDDARRLYDKISFIALQQIEDFTNKLRSQNYVRVKQDHILANSWRKRGIKDGEIDWRMSSSNIYNLVRALSEPYVGAHFIYNEREIKTWKVEEVKNELYNNIESGKILEVFSKNSFLIKCGQNCINVVYCDLDELLIKGKYL